MLQENSEAPNGREREITQENLRVEQRCAVAKIYNGIGNKKRDERHREFVLVRKVRRAAKRNRRERCEVGKPACAGMNQESRRDAIGDDGKNEEKSGNHSEESICPGRYAKGIY